MPYDETDAGRHRGDDARRRSARRRACRRPNGGSIATSTRARADAGAIVHTHAPFATSLACLHRGIPAFHYMVAVAGGRGHPLRAVRDVRHAGAVRPRARRARRAPRLPARQSRHDRVRRDRSTRALALAVEVETLAEMYWRALQVGEPRSCSTPRKWPSCWRSSRPTDIRRVRHYFRTARRMGRCVAGESSV